MANGAAHPLESEILSPEDTLLETRIGSATASAVEALARGVLDYAAAGRMLSDTKALCGERLAKLYELQQAHAGKLDFPATVREAGKRELFQRHGSAALPESEFDFLIAHALAIVSRVERAMAH